MYTYNCVCQSCSKKIFFCIILCFQSFLSLRDRDRADTIRGVIVKSLTLKRSLILFHFKVVNKKCTFTIQEIETEYVRFNYADISIDMGLNFEGKVRFCVR